MPVAVAEPKTTITDSKTSICYVNENSNTDPYLSPSPEVGLLKLSPPPTKVTPSPLSMAHHNPLNSKTSSGIYYKRGVREREGYGVPQTRRILTMGLFHKRHDDIRRFLISLGLENRERDAIFGLLRLYCHYGKTYPKAADLASDERISKRTFWRAIHKLHSLGVIEVVNRYFNHRQISNLYRLDKLVVMIARRLAERGQQFNDFATKLVCFFGSFWREIWAAEINLSETAPIKLKTGGG